MARKSSSDNNDDILMKGISNANSSINEVSEKVGQSQKEIKKLNSKADRVARATDKVAKNTDTTNSELKDIKRSIDNSSKRVEKKLDDLTKAINKIGTAGGAGAPVQSPVSVSPASGTRTSQSTALVPVGGSKIMGTVPSAALPSDNDKTTAQLPGSKVPLLPGSTASSPAATAQGNRLVNSIKGVGIGIKDFLGGKAFWGKMAGAVAEGLIASKLFSSTIGDLLKLGVFLISNFVRNIFGKHMGGITAILLTMAGGIAGLGGLIGSLGAFRKALSLGHGLRFAGRAALAGATRFPRHLMRAGRRIFSTGVASRASEEGVKLLEDKAAKEVAKKTTEKAGGKILAKGAAKTVGKKIPGLGLLVGTGLAAGKALHGDFLGAVGEFASGALGGLGGPLGTAASLGIDAWLMKRDMDIAGGKKVAGMRGVKGTGEAVKAVGKSPVLRTLGKIAIGITIISDIVQKIWHFFNRSPFSGGKEFLKALSNKVGDFFTPQGEELSNGTVKGTDTPAGKILSDIQKHKDSKEKQSQLIKSLFGKDAVISSGTGWRTIRDPNTGELKKEYHSGIDVAKAAGKPQAAAIGGKVTFMGMGANENQRRGYGNVIEIEKDGVVYRYAHLGSFNKDLKVGSTVGRGTVLGTVGSTGYSTGPHTHFEALLRGKNGSLSRTDTYTAVTKALAKEAMEEAAKKKANEAAKKKATSDGSVPIAPKKEYLRDKLLKKIGIDREEIEKANKDIFGEGKPTGFAADISKSVSTTPHKVASTLPSATEIIQTNKTGNGLSTNQSLAMLYMFA